MEDLSISRSISKRWHHPFELSTTTIRFYTVDSGFFCQWNLDSGFQSLERSGLSYNPDSTRKNYPDSVFHEQKLFEFRNPDSLIWGELFQWWIQWRGPLPLNFFLETRPPLSKAASPSPLILKTGCGTVFAWWRLARKIVDADLEGFHCLTNVLLIN